MNYAVLYAFMSQVDMGHFRAYLGYGYSRVLARQSRAWGEEALMLPEAGGVKGCHYSYPDQDNAEDEYTVMASLLM